MDLILPNAGGIARYVFPASPRASTDSASAETTAILDGTGSQFGGLG